MGDIYADLSVVGVREDLSDVVTSIAPVDALFYAAIGSANATQEKHEWVTDTLAAAASNAAVSGADSTTETQTAGTRLYNNCQIQKKVPQIADRNNVIKSAGNVSSEDYITAKNMKQLMKDVEYAFLLETRQDGVANTTAPKMRGAANWITTNLDKASDATLNANGTVTGGTARELTKELVKGVMQDIYDAGGDPTKAYCGSFQATQFSAFANANNYRQAVENGKLNDYVDIYVNEFGKLEVVPHRILSASKADIFLIMDMSYWKKATLRPMRKEQLAKTGDSTKLHIIVDHTLEANAENSSGRITNLTTS